MPRVLILSRLAAPCLITFLLLAPGTVAPGLAQVTPAGPGSDPAAQAPDATVVDTGPAKLEEMYSWAVDRRAEARAKAMKELDGLFLTLENNPPGSSVAVGAQKRLLALFPEALDRLVEGIQSTNAQLALSCAIIFRDRALANGGRLPDELVGPIIETLATGSDLARNCALRVASTLDDARVLSAVRQLLAREETPADLKSQALRLLANRQDPEAVGLFLAALTDQSAFQTREVAVRALGALGIKKALEPIWPLTEDPSFEVREATYEAIGKLGDRSSVNLLFEKLDALLTLPGMNTGEKTIHNLARWIVNSIEAIGDPMALDGLRTRAGTFPEPVQGHMLESANDLIKTSVEAGSTAALSHIRPFLESPNNVLRQSAFDAVARLRDRAAVPVLVDMLDEATLADKVHITRTLAAINDPDPTVIAKLRRLLKHSNPSVQREAAFALADLGDSSGRSVLVAPLRSAIQADSNNLDAMLTLAYNYWRIGDYRDAISTYKRALRTNKPKDEKEIYLGMARCHSRLKDQRETEECLLKCEKAGRPRLEIWNAVAQYDDFAYLREQWRESSDAADKINLADAFQRLRRDEEALDWYREALATNPDDQRRGRIFLEMAISYARLQKFDLVTKHLQMAQALGADVAGALESRSELRPYKAQQR